MVSTMNKYLFQRSKGNTQHSQRLGWSPYTASCTVYDYVKSNQQQTNMPALLSACSAMHDSKEYNQGDLGYGVQEGDHGRTSLVW